MVEEDRASVRASRRRAPSNLDSGSISFKIFDRVFSHLEGSNFGFRGSLIFSWLEFDGIVTTSGKWSDSHLSITSTKAFPTKEDEKKT